MLPLVNRSAILLTPRQPFLDWADNVFGDGVPYQQAVRQGVADERSVYLGPDGDLTGDPFRFIDRHWDLFFETMLENWCTDPALWPAKRTRKMFREWFEVTVFGVLYDALEAPLVAE